MAREDRSWLEGVAELCGSGAVLLNAGGELEGADAGAVTLGGAADYAGLVEIWRTVTEKVAALCAAPATARGTRGTIELASGSTELASGSTVIRLLLRVVKIGGERESWLGLLSKAAAEPEQDERIAFARQVGHDLRGPLNAMVLNLDLLRTSLEREQVEEEIAAKRRRYLGALQREIERMNETLTVAVNQVRNAASR